MRGLQRRGDGIRARSGWGSGLAGILVTLTMLVPMGPARAATRAVDCDTQDLQAAINASSPGDTLFVSGTCYGTFTITQGLILAGNPSATLDGERLGPTLSVNTTEAVHLRSLEITDGRNVEFSDNGTGGGIESMGTGPLTLSHVTVDGNEAGDINPNLASVIARGGGIAAVGSLTLSYSSVVDNEAIAGPQGVAFGGGIDAEGNLTVLHSAVSSNRASVANCCGSSAGGGILTRGQSVKISSSHLDGNRAVEAGGGSGAASGGGIVYVPGLSGGTLSISSSTINNNRASASASLGAPASVEGGGLRASGGNVARVTVNRSTFLGNEARASGSLNTSTGQGGAIFAETADGLTLTSTRVAGSLLSVSSSSPDTAEGDGGGVFIDQAAAGGLKLSKSTVDGNRILTSSAGGLATGVGGGIDSGNAVTADRSTVSRNSIKSTTAAPAVAAGQGGGLELDSSPNAITNSTITGNAIGLTSLNSGGTANGNGGGIDSSSGRTSFLDVTVARNTLAGSATSGNLAGGGLFADAESTSLLKATILALDTAGGGDSDLACNGTMTSKGHNLIQKIKGCSFATASTDKIGANPKLGTLANNGGPTQTLALLSGSPALDAVPITACAVKIDQRGVKRPQGPGCDIGAFELKA
jgi:fibronectin-binding autotransporter adhesin